MNSLQQQIATNERLDDLVLAMGALNNETAVNLVGRSVVVEGDAFPHTAGESDELVFELAAEAATVDITVIDADGKVVDVITREDAKAGEQSVSWDGWDDDIKAPFPEGDYTFRVSAKDADGNPVAARTFVRGLVTELRFDGGTPQVVVGGHPFLLSAIDRVLGGEPVGGAAAADASDASDDPSADPPDPAADPELAPGVTAANLSALKASLSALGFLQ
jgi:flagellar hook assembly protein FlgD